MATAPDTMKTAVDDYRLYYVAEPWSAPYETELGDPDGYLRDVAPEDVGEEIETLVPGKYELRRAGDPVVMITIAAG